ncbi:hypothetical protein H5P28_17205 [Ruficoccus amylovorans]|uniref:PEP-CTERM protein-sorting domain-containing protein n=1 Tax=Ruficoccus amylovorans TaxID=1804625 RepID=A0A842HKK4_9BACT|nr:hypothetical protein [Ruficoccus amylovorans]MBC2596007.1 hypothetical protein [Ruficoccus amylovorans]
MKNTPRFLLLLAASALGITSLHASTVVFSDDFNRANVGPTNNDTLIGNGWVWPQADGEWAINDGTLVTDKTTPPAPPTGAPRILNQSVSLSDTQSFTYSVDIFAADASTGWIGLMFDVHSMNNFEIVRFKIGSNSYQALRMEGGSPVTSTLVTKSDATETFTANTWYTITVTTYVEDVEGSIEFSITRRGSEENLNVANTANFGADPESWTNNGFGLFAESNGKPTFDNMLVTTVPEPGETSLCLLALAGAFTLLGRRYLRSRK